MRGRGAGAARAGLALTSALVTTLVTPAVVEPASAVPAALALEPPGSVTLLEGGGWSWFEEARATFSPDGDHLLVSAVAGDAAESVAPGTVVLSQVDLASGARQLVDLGRAEADDHNSASIDVGPAGEVLTSWSRHHLDTLVRHQRRRTDGSWLRLPPTAIGARTTYANLRRAADAEGNPILYDFVRGERFDPVALASPDEGRTWTNLGPVLRDPGNVISVRPYVQYAEARDGRIHLVATETHPDTAPTSIYHGYIEGGSVYGSAGQLLGPVGSGVSVTSLTPVWQATAQERGWSTDIEVDPATGRPVITFSTTRSTTDHRYRYATWNGLLWTTQEMAFAGNALYSQEESYTGLASIDPANPSRVVISSDVDPDDGSPLVSATDGEQHWELFEGQRGLVGQWTWSPLTADSDEDNLRPLLVVGRDAEQALVWLRGTYDTFLSYDLEVAGVIRRANGSLVPGGGATWVPAVDTLPNPTPLSAVGRPVVGAFDGHAAADLFLARPGSARDDLVLGDEHRHPTPIQAPSAPPDAIPVAGDFDGNGRTDVLWYRPGSGSEGLWRSSGIGVFQSAPVPAVNGIYTPVPGDFDRDGDTDIYWYAPGAAADHLWRATPAGFSSRVPTQVKGSYTPVPGDFTGDDRTDILWYAPGSGPEYLWTATATGFSSAAARASVSGTYTPVPGDFTGDDRIDILWYAPGAGADHLWISTASGFVSTPKQINGTYLPVAGDLDGDGADDIHWYAPGASPDFLWWSADGALADSEVAALNL